MVKRNSNVESDQFSLYSLVEYQTLKSLLLLSKEEMKECAYIIHQYLEQLTLYRIVVLGGMYTLPSFSSFLSSLKQVALQCYEKISVYTLAYSPFTFLEKVIGKSVDQSPELIPHILSIFLVFQSPPLSSIPQNPSSSTPFTKKIYTRKRWKRKMTSLIYSIPSPILIFSPSSI